MLRKRFSSRCANTVVFAERERLPGAQAGVFLNLRSAIANPQLKAPASFPRRLRIMRREADAPEAKTRAIRGSIALEQSHAAQANGLITGTPQFVKSATFRVTTVRP